MVSPIPLKVCVCVWGGGGSMIYPPSRHICCIITVIQSWLIQSCFSKHIPEKSRSPLQRFPMLYNSTCRYTRGLGWGLMRGYRGGGGWCSDPPPLRLSAIFCCLLICPGPCNNLDPLLKFLYEPPPPLLNVRNPPFWILDPRLRSWCPGAKRTNTVEYLSNI